MTTFTRRATAAAAATLVIAAMLAGCSGSEADGTHSEGSRVRLYHSVHELAADSAAIVEGTVTGQRTATDLENSSAVFTISTVTVTDAPKGTGLTPGSTVVVRQDGDAKHIGPAPLLTVGSSYLLYLTLSALPGLLATQYYVTGGTAGIYQADTSGQAAKSVAPSGKAFTHIPSNEGDTLPATVDLSNAQG